MGSRGQPGRRPALRRSRPWAAGRPISNALGRYGLSRAHRRSNPEGHHDCTEPDLTPLGQATRYRDPTFVQMSPVLAAEIFQHSLATGDDNPRVVPRHAWGVDRNRRVSHDRSRSHPRLKECDVARRPATASRPRLRGPSRPHRQRLRRRSGSRTHRRSVRIWGSRPSHEERDGSRLPAWRGSSPRRTSTAIAAAAVLPWRPHEPGSRRAVRADRKPSATSEFRCRWKELTRVVVERETFEAIAHAASRAPRTIRRGSPATRVLWHMRRSRSHLGRRWLSRFHCATDLPWCSAAS